MMLLDTHTVLWAMAGDARLGGAARRAFEDDTASLFVSAASVWEMAIKLSIGKLSLQGTLKQLVDEDLVSLGIPVLPVEARHTFAVQHLPWHHRDPFDRLLVAVSQVDAMPIVSADAALDAYGVKRIW